MMETCAQSMQSLWHDGHGCSENLKVAVDVTDALSPDLKPWA